jgi:N-acetylglucosamine-6-phosphate deacetylase
MLAPVTATIAQTAPVNGMRPSEVRAHAITNATVIVSPGARLEGATILIRDGVIEAVGGADLPLPGDARVWDASGLTVYPGLIESAIMLPPGEAPTGAGAHWNRRIHPQITMADRPGTPDQKTREEFRKLGFTAAAIYPSTGILRGSGVVIALANDEPHALAYGNPAAMVAGFDVGGGRRRGAPAGEPQPEGQGYPGSLMGGIALIRQTLYDAQWHAACRRIFAEHPEGNEPPIRADALVALQGVVERRQPLLFDVNDELNALRAAKIINEFNVEGILLGSGLEFRRYDELAATKLPVILPLNYPERPKVDALHEADRVTLRDLMTWEQAPTNARRMIEAGSTVALTTHRLKSRAEFPAALHKAIQHGLSEDDALAALTTVPAQLLGLDATLGTIEAGKAANLVVVDGKLFDKKPKVRDVWIDGRRFEITAQPIVKFKGPALLVIDGGGPGDDPPRQLELSVDTEKSQINLSLPENKRDRAKRVIVQRDSIAFVLDGKHLGAEGFVQFTGLISKDKIDGSGVMPDGSPFSFAITPRPKDASESEDDEDDGGDEGGEGAKRDADDDPEEVDPGGGAVARENDTAEIEGDENPEIAAVKGDEVKRDLAADPAKGVMSDEKDKDEGEGDDRGEKKEPPFEMPPAQLNFPLGEYGFYQRPRPQRVLITNATIWTCAPDANAEDAIIENGFMVVADGKIEMIGADIDLQQGEGMTVIDAKGKHITPGLIDCHSHTGISGGVNEGGQAVTAEVRIGDAIDPDDIGWYRELAGGLTAANQLHGSANPIGGQNSVVKLKWGSSAGDFSIPDAIAGIKFALGENVTRSQGRYPGTRMGVETLIRDSFTAAGDYRDAWSRYLGMSEGERAAKYPPRRDLELDALVEILEGRRLVHCHSYRQDEILMLIRVAESFGFTIGTFQHVLEGYKVAEAIAEHGAGASSFSDWWAYKIEVMDAIPYNGSLMTHVGVNVSFNSDSNELARRMNTEAAKAVRYGGLEPHEALRLVTINPARQLRIDQRTGSLEIGKDADFVIWSGDPLSTYTRCEQTWIEGTMYFDIESDLGMRELVRAERQRLIQKALADAHSGSGRSDGDGPGGRGGGERPDAERNEDRPPPTGRLMARLWQQQVDWMLQQVARGYDPDEIRPGDCGCNDVWWRMMMEQAGRE